MATVVSRDVSLPAGRATSGCRMPERLEQPRSAIRRLQLTAAQLRAPTPHELATGSLAQDAICQRAQLFRAHRGALSSTEFDRRGIVGACQAMTSSTNVSSHHSSSATGYPRSRSWPANSARRRPSSGTLCAGWRQSTASCSIRAAPRYGSRTRSPRRQPVSGSPTAVAAGGRRACGARWGSRCLQRPTPPFTHATAARPNPRCSPSVSPRRSRRRRSSTFRSRSARHGTTVALVRDRAAVPRT